MKKLDKLVVASEITYGVCTLIDVGMDIKRYHDRRTAKKRAEKFDDIDNIRLRTGLKLRTGMSL